MLRYIVFSVASLTLTISTCLTALADGVFIPYAKWNKTDRLVEPEQKAIIVYDQGIENLFLRVKYEGNIDDFCWLIPVPSEPEVRALTFSPFTQMKLNSGCGSPELGSRLFISGLHDRVLHKGRELKPKQWREWTDRILGPGQPPSASFESHDTKETGPYEITILKGDKSSELLSWLRQHGYKPRPGTERVLQNYLDREWVFVAARIRLSARTKENQQKFQSGQLAPLLLKFKAEAPVYPLLISSLNGDKTDLLIEVIARSLYVSEILQSSKDDYRTPRQLEKEFMDSIQTGRDIFEIIFGDDDYMWQKLRYRAPLNYSEISMPSVIRYELRSPLIGDWHSAEYQKTLSAKIMTKDIVFSASRKDVAKYINRVLKLEKEAGYPEPKTAIIPPDPYPTPQGIADVFKASKRPYDIRDKKAVAAWLSKRELTDDLARCLLIHSDVLMDFYWSELHTTEERLDFFKHLYAHTRETVFMLRNYPAFQSFLKLCTDLPFPPNVTVFGGTSLYPPLFPFEEGHYHRPKKWPTNAVEYCNYTHEGKKYRDYFPTQGSWWFEIYKPNRTIADFFNPDLITPSEHLEYLRRLCLAYLYFYRDPRTFTLMKDWLDSKDERIARTAANLMMRATFNTPEYAAQDKRAYYCGPAPTDAEILRIIHKAADNPLCRDIAVRIMDAKNDPALPKYVIANLNYFADLSIKGKNVKDELEAHQRFTNALFRVICNSGSEEYKPVIKKLLVKYPVMDHKAISLEALLYTARKYNDPEITALTKSMGYLY